MTCWFPQKVSGGKCAQNGRSPKKAAIIHKILSFVGTIAAFIKAAAQCFGATIVSHGLHENHRFFTRRTGDKPLFIYTF
ncbi:hypothetical protein EBI69_16035 [Salmonella enterica]|nr:hypothetical protein [Salmonella enterica]